MRPALRSIFFEIEVAYYLRYRQEVEMKLFQVEKVKEAFGSITNACGFVVLYTGIRQNFFAWIGSDFPDV